MEFSPRCNFQENDPATALWEDADAKYFYERLNDLRETLPGVLFGIKPLPVESHAETTVAAEEKEKQMAADAAEDARLEKELEDGAGDLDSAGDADLGLGSLSLDEASEPSDDVVAPTASEQLQALLLRLPKCVNRDFIDKAASDFCFLNTKVLHASTHVLIPAL